MVIEQIKTIKSFNLITEIANRSEPVVCTYFFFFLDKVCTYFFATSGATNMCFIYKKTHMCFVFHWYARWVSYEVNGTGTPIHDHK